MIVLYAIAFVLFALVSSRRMIPVLIKPVPYDIEQMSYHLLSESSLPVAELHCLQIISNAKDGP